MSNKQGSSKSQVFDQKYESTSYSSKAKLSIDKSDASPKFGQTQWDEQEQKRVKQKCAENALPTFKSERINAKNCIF